MERHVGASGLLQNIGFVTFDRRRQDQGLHGDQGDRIPLPPDDLAGRVGSQIGEEFLQIGIRAKECIARALDAHQSDMLERYRTWPFGKWIACALAPHFSFRRKRILDFGCGVGRLLRHCLE
ncbi:MAG: hypothetical protein ACREJ6_08885, partial [Candidatus Methylomirabilis sp.]